VNAVNYRPDIDGLRALAVLSVLLYHVSPGRVPGGFLGVDVFFVISGYLISLIIFREQSAGMFSFSEFFIRRVRRLFPALIVILLSVMVFGAFALFPDEYQRLAKHVGAAILFLLNLRLMGEAGYFDVASDSKPLLHLWSLSVEEQFYLVWPALVVMLWPIRKRIGWIIGALAIGSFACAISLAGHKPDAVYFHPIARFWELLLGAGLAYWHHLSGVNSLPSKLDYPWFRNALSFIGLTTILTSFFLFEGKTSHPGPLTLLPLLGVVAVIASGSRALGNGLISIRPIVWIGLISYPLYLWHWPVLSYIRVMESQSPSLSLLLAGAGVSVLLAALTYRYIELPLRHSQRFVLVGLVGAMTTLLLGAIAIVVFRGFPDRPFVEYAKQTAAQMKREPETDESCIQLFKTNAAPVYCRQHTPGDQMIGLIGDSHAHVLFPGIAEQAERAGYGTLLLANSGCPPLDGSATGKTDGSRRECAISIEKILSSIVSDERIKHVILATRGPIYLYGKGFGPTEVDYNDPPISDARQDALHSENGVGPFTKALQSTVQRLLDSGKTVSYFLQVPELGIYPYNCLGRPLTLVSKPFCGVTVKEYQDRMSEYRALVKSVQISLPALSVWDPQPLFCDSEYCHGLIQNKLMYADDDHLSKEGSRLVAAYFASLIYDLRDKPTIN
jgi:peptidoglycan/LPS O-acetylase OafA/YrhL